MGIELYSGLIEFNWTLPMVAITLIVLYLILKKFFFERIHNFMLDREHAVEDSFAHADRTNELAEQRLEEYQTKLSEIDEERRTVLLSAKREAEDRAQAIVDQANEQAQQIIAAAKAEAQRQQEAAAAGMRDQIAALVLLAAGKVLEKELLDDGAQNQLIEQAVKEMRQGQWQRN